MWREICEVEITFYFGAVQCSEVQGSTMKCNAVQCSTNPGTGNSIAILWEEDPVECSVSLAQPADVRYCSVLLGGKLSKSSITVK